MVGLELALRRGLAKELGDGLELVCGESRRMIEVLVEVSPLVKFTAGSRLGVTTAVTTGGRLGAVLQRVS